MDTNAAIALTGSDIKPGIHDISIEAYHSSAGISRSAIMSFRKSPKHYHHEYILGNREQASSDALVFGNALHTYILEPEKFLNEFYIWEKQPRNIKAGKDSWAQAVVDAGNRQIIDSEMMDNILGISRSIKDNQLADGLITGGQYEKSIYWIDEETGLLCKCRPDILHRNFVGDLKTTRQATFGAFQRSLYDYGYHIQAGMIFEGLRVLTGREYKDFVFITTEKEAPYMNACYQLDEYALAQGIADFHDSLRAMKECMTTNVWPGYPNATMGLPKWVS